MRRSTTKTNIYLFFEPDLLDYIDNVFQSHTGYAISLKEDVRHSLLAVAVDSHQQNQIGPELITLIAAHTCDVIYRARGSNDSEMINIQRSGSSMSSQNNGVAVLKRRVTDVFSFNAEASQTASQSEPDER